jgi:hypothetical protein
VTAQITELTPGTIYGFSVKALNVVGDSEFSQAALIMAATVPDPPSQPVMDS